MLGVRKMLFTLVSVFKSLLLAIFEKSACTAIERRLELSKVPVGQVSWAITSRLYALSVASCPTSEPARATSEPTVSMTPVRATATRFNAIRFMFCFLLIVCFVPQQTCCGCLHALWVPVSEPEKRNLCANC